MVSILPSYPVRLLVCSLIAVLDLLHPGLACAGGDDHHALHEEVLVRTRPGRASVWAVSFG